MSATHLTPRISRGILNLPTGDGAKSKLAAERLLEQDRDTFHCYFNKMGFHNHLSHHILAAFDLGASADLLQVIYDDEKKTQKPIHIINRETGEEKELDVEITEKNWTQYLSDEKYYASFLAFYAGETKRFGVAETIEKCIFSPEANGNGTEMLMRLISGAAHPFIQVGYALEFNSPAMVAQGLAMAAVTKPAIPAWPGFSMPSDSSSSGPASHGATVNAGDASLRQPSVGPSLLSILREAYNSEAFTPPLPYDPNKLLSQRMRDAVKGGQINELQRLAALWEVDASGGDAEFAARAEELIWLSTLLLAGTGKPGRKPRLDFFLMHVLNSTIFLPAYLKAISKAESKARLLRAHFVIVLHYLQIRGRPRIDPELLMSYTAFPRPPSYESKVEFSKDALGSANSEAGQYINPWPAMVADVLHAPDAHTQKALRLLYYAAQKYGDTPSGGAIGAFERDTGGAGKETHKGTARMDGTIFVRAAGVLMQTLGWVTHGQKEGAWDRSALGWDDAWKNED